MQVVVPKPPTYQTEVWDGTNTAAFKVWAEPFLPILWGEYVRAWRVIDNNLDPENVIEDGILQAYVPGVGYSSYTTDFILGKTALAGPLFDGQASTMNLTTVVVLSAAEVAELYDLVPPAVQQVDPKAVVAVRK